MPSYLPFGFCFRSTLWGNLGIPVLQMKKLRHREIKWLVHVQEVPSPDLRSASLVGKTAGFSHLNHQVHIAKARFCAHSGDSVRNWPTPYLEDACRLICQRHWRNKQGLPTDDRFNTCIGILRPPPTPLKRQQRDSLKARTKEKWKGWGEKQQRPNLRSWRAYGRLRRWGSWMLSWLKPTEFPQWS